MPKIIVVPFFPDTVLYTVTVLANASKATSIFLSFFWVTPG